MERLERDKTYYFKDELTFKHPLDNVHYFVMENYNIGMHKQSFFEINVVVRGSGEHHIEGAVIPAEVGDVFIIPPEVEHGYTGGEGFDVYHIIVRNRFIQRNIAELQQIDGFSILFNVEPIMRAKANKHLHLKLNEEQFEFILPMLEHRKKHNRFLSPEDSFISTGYLMIIITELCKIYVKNSETLIHDSNVNDAAFMKSLAMIHERYAEKLTIDELAREAKLSKSTYMRRFVYVCKMPPAEYITKKRIEVAENMLAHSKESIMAIAEAVGFYDAAHFSRTFKKVNGISPLEYRKSNKS